MKRKFLIVLSLILLLSSCKEKEKVVIEKPKPPKETLQDVDLEKWRAELNRPVYTIDNNQIKNPFITPKTYLALTKKESNIPVQLVGILKGRKKKMALLQDPTKKGYIVKEGDKLGESTIKEIGDNYIIIEEVSENIFGQKTKKVRKITLLKEERQ